MKPDGLCVLFEDDKSLRVAMGTFSWTVSIWSILFWYWDRYSAFSEAYLWSTSLIVFFFTGSGNSTVDSEIWKPRMREVTDEKDFRHLPRRLRAIQSILFGEVRGASKKINRWKKLIEEGLLKLPRCATGAPWVRRLTYRAPTTHRRHLRTLHGSLTSIFLSLFQLMQRTSPKRRDCL